MRVTITEDEGFLTAIAELSKPCAACPVPITITKVFHHLTGDQPPEKAMAELAGMVKAWRSETVVHDTCPGRGAAEVA